MHRRQGLTGPPLNELGRAQARELAARLASTRIDTIYSSDSSRAVETAEIVARPHGLRVCQDHRLREVSRSEPVTRASVLVVTSGGPIRAVQAEAEGVDQALARLHFEGAPNCAVLEVQVESSGLTIVPA